MDRQYVLAQAERWNKMSEAAKKAWREREYKKQGNS